jgi:hypothetical protein
MTFKYLKMSSTLGLEKIFSGVEGEFSFLLLGLKVMVKPPSPMVDLISFLIKAGVPKGFKSN